MKIFQRIWGELRRGENIDVYLTIFIAAILSVASITGFYRPPSDTLTSILLGILALLAITNLKGRYAIEKLSEQLSNSAKPPFLEEFSSTLIEELISSPDVWLVGVSLSRTIRTHYSDIERKLQKGHKIRVLLVHPDGPAAEMAASRPYPKTNIEKTRRQIHESLGNLCTLKDTKPDKIGLRFEQSTIL